MTAASAPVPELLVQLDGVFARDRAAIRGRARGALAGVTAWLGPGIHAFFGGPEDGTMALAEVLSGEAPPSRGRAIVAGGDPWRSHAARARLASLGVLPHIADAPTVRGAVDLVRAAAGWSFSADVILNRLDLSQIARRAPASLSFAEARAVELALALAAPDPLVAVWFEPAQDIAIAGALKIVREHSRALAAKGACVVWITSSASEARSVAKEIFVLDRGAIARRVPGDGAGLGAQDVQISVWIAPSETAADDVRALAKAISDHPSVLSLRWREPRDRDALPALQIETNDRDAIALALVDAAVAANVTIRAMRTDAPDLLAVRARTAAIAKAAQTQKGSDPRPGGAA